METNFGIKVSSFKHYALLASGGFSNRLVDLDAQRFRHYRKQRNLPQINVVSQLCRASALGSILKLISLI